MCARVRAYSIVFVGFRSTLARLDSTLSLSLQYPPILLRPLRLLRTARTAPYYCVFGQPTEPAIFHPSPGVFPARRCKPHVDSARPNHLDPASALSRVSTISSPPGNASPWAAKLPVDTTVPPLPRLPRRDHLSQPTLAPSSGFDAPGLDPSAAHHNHLAVRHRPANFSLSDRAPASYYTQPLLLLLLLLLLPPAQSY